LKVYGLTGGIASGKSTVAALLIQAGYEVVDSDEIVKILYGKGEAIYNAILGAFGGDILTSDGNIDRKRLGDLIFNNLEARQKLNAVTHPVIRHEIEKRLEACRIRGDRIVFVDVPLLYESETFGRYDGVILVYAKVSLQLSRLMARNGFSEEEADIRIKSQLPIEEKRARADFIVDNQGSINQLKHEVMILIDLLEKRLGQT
jgi:dephospho-CoA kinase